MHDSKRARRSRAVAVVALALAVLVSACSSQERADPSGAPPATVAPVRLVEPAEFEELISAGHDTLVVNVHVPYEGHIAGTTDFVAYDTIGTWGKLPGDRHHLIALYCRSGNMSAEAAATLARDGYTNIVDLHGGMQAWTASGRTLLLQRT